MRDQFERTINYMRLSITERCNLRCRYCMPQGSCAVEDGGVLTAAELLRVAEAAVPLGIRRFKITGGEPMARWDAVELIASLKALPGVEQVTLTTNGTLLKHHLTRLSEIGLDGLNISLDAPNEQLYGEISGSSSVFSTVLENLHQAAALGIPLKLNCVLLPENLSVLPELAKLARQNHAILRFIELMPLGEGVGKPIVSSEQAVEQLTAAGLELHPIADTFGNGPARYYAVKDQSEPIGMIDAISHQFCDSCNRVRLTSRGQFKPCLCYGGTLDMRELLRQGASQETLTAALGQAIYSKPSAHCFLTPQAMTEHHKMNEIGG